MDGTTLQNNILFNFLKLNFLKCLFKIFFFFTFEGIRNFLIILLFFTKQILVSVFLYHLILSFKCFYNTLIKISQKLFSILSQFFLINLFISNIE